MEAAFVHGFLLAIGLIIPLGVQNFFVFSQGAVRRFPRVLPIAVTAGVCDTLLILLAVSGVSVIVLHFEWMKRFLLIGGVLFLAYMGYQSWRAKPAADAASAGGGAQSGERALRLIGYTMMISILNPHAILDTVGVIGTSSIQYTGGEKLAFTLACVIVSWCWFFLLAAAGHLLGSRDAGSRFAAVLSKVSAIVMWAAGAYLFSTW